MVEVWLYIKHLFILLQLFSVQVHGLWKNEHYSLFTSYFGNIGVQSLSIYACSVNEAHSFMKYVTDHSNMIVKVHSAQMKKEIITDSKHYVQGVVMDFQCYHDSNNWMNEMFNTSYKWMIYVETWEHIGQLVDTRLNLLSDVVVANCSDNNCILLDASRIRAIYPLEFTEIGLWQDSTLTYNGKPKRQDLRGMTLIGSLVIAEIKNFTGIPPHLEDKSYYPGKDLFSRYHVSLYTHMSILFNYRLKVVRSATYGYPLPNGSYDGLIGDIVSEKIDVGLTSIEPRPGRAVFVNFLLPLWKIKMIFILRQPRALGSFSALALPLSSEVWVSVLILGIVFAVCYGVIQNCTDQERTAASYFEGIIVVIGVLSQQGLLVDATKTSSRMLCFFLLFLGLILITYYNAAIMNALLLPAPASIRSLEQLLAPTSPIRPGLLNITYLVDNRSAHKYVLPNTVKAIKRTPNPIMDLKPGIKRVKDSQFAFCAEDNLLFEEIHRTFDDAQKCDLSYIELLKPFGLSGAISKSSPFKEIISRGLIYLMENGLVDREKKHWRPHTPQCLGSISFMYVTLKAVGMSFTIFLIGVFASFMIFVAEYCHHRKKNQILHEEDKKMKRNLK